MKRGRLTAVLVVAIIGGVIGFFGGSGSHADPYMIYPDVPYHAIKESLAADYPKRDMRWLGACAGALLFGGIAWVSSPHSRR